MWEAEFTDEFGEWWETLNEAEQDAVAFTVGLLRNEGPSLKFPYSTGVKHSQNINPCGNYGANARDSHYEHFMLLIQDVPQFF